MPNLSRDQTLATTFLAQCTTLSIVRHIFMICVSTTSLAGRTFKCRDGKGFSLIHGNKARWNMDEGEWRAFAFTLMVVVQSLIRVSASWLTPRCICFSINSTTMLLQYALCVCEAASCIFVFHIQGTAAALFQMDFPLLEKAATIVLHRSYCLAPATTF